MWCADNWVGDVFEAIFETNTSRTRYRGESLPFGYSGFAVNDNMFCGNDFEMMMDLGRVA
ncbi:MAG: hypothetical protein COA43_03940 [Robiginitomaculum sp.]|nr:MAG: hypothetical protein COA43_03940 [Robiginitomaculum sp.]